MQKCCAVVSLHRMPLDQMFQRNWQYINRPPWFALLW